LEVAQKLRHAKVTTTLSTYGHLFPGTDGLERTREDAAADLSRHGDSTAVARL
jgi:hypothetical protein